MKTKLVVIVGIILAISIMSYGQTNFDEVRKAAEQGDADAQNHLGVMYKKGEGVQADFKIAASWFRKAAKQGYAPAETNLGLLYEAGEGVETDLNQALSWFMKAAQQGDTDAKNGIVAVRLLLKAEADEQRSQDAARQLAAREEPALEEFVLDSSVRQASSAAAAKGLPAVNCEDIGSGFKDCITQRGKRTDSNFLGLQLSFFKGSLYQVSYLFPAAGFSEFLHALSNRYGAPESLPRGGKRWKFGATDRQLVMMQKGDEENLWMAVLFDVKMLARRDADDAANSRGRYGH